MLTNDQLIFDVITRDALLIFNGAIHHLDGPFQSREQAEAAAQVVIGRMASEFAGDPTVTSESHLQ